MAKLATKEIQSNLIKLGEQLGFISRLEYCFPNQKNYYQPRYDVVWLLDVSTLAIDEILMNSLIEDSLLPFAAFEVEGSTTSSKNQLGNVGNLRMSPCYFNFIVVNNAGAGKENDTYRRGIKIVRTIQELMGEKQIFLLDSHLLSNLPELSITNIFIEQKDTKRLTGSGGEIQSLPIATKLVEQLSRTGLQIEHDRTPDYFTYAFHVKKRHLASMNYTVDPVSFAQKEIRSDTTYYYKPKIDIAAGFQISGGFVEFLKEIAVRLRTDSIHFPLLQYLHDKQSITLYYPLLGIEIEMKESKHALGSLMNLANFHQIGWLIAPASMNPYVEAFKAQFGMQHVFIKNSEDL